MHKPFTPIDPAHYRQGPVECIDAIEAIGCGPDFCRGQVIKYLWRLGLKGDVVQDAKKAQWYMDRLVKILEDEART
jgi:hypothetical protein